MERVIREWRKPFQRLLRLMVKVLKLLNNAMPYLPEFGSWNITMKKKKYKLSSPLQALFKLAILS